MGLTSGFCVIEGQFGQSEAAAGDRRSKRAKSYYILTSSKGYAKTGMRASESIKREAEDKALPAEKKVKSYRGCRHCK